MALETFGDTMDSAKDCALPQNEEFVAPVSKPFCTPSTSIDMISDSGTRQEKRRMESLLDNVEFVIRH
jgi:hypothetical protein